MSLGAHLVTKLRTLGSTSDAEVCGALVGCGSSISEIWPLPNRSARPESSFFIAAADVLMAERQAQARGLELVGFYHSHPRTSAMPSESDTAQALPGYIYAIITHAGDIRVWRLRADRAGFDEVL